MTEVQEQITADKIARAAARKARSEAIATGDSFYTEPVAATPLAVATDAVPFLVEPRGLPGFAGLSAETVAAEAEFTKASDAWKADRERLNGLRHVDNAETVTLAELRGRSENAIGLELTLAQSAVTLNRRYVELQQTRLPELREAVVAQEKNLAKVEAAVAEKLNAAGVSVQSQRAWPDAPESAEIQFAHTIRQAAEWQRANESLGAANAAVQATADAITAGRVRIDEAVKSLSQKVAKLVA